MVVLQLERGKQFRDGSASWVLFVHHCNSEMGGEGKPYEQKREGALGLLYRPFLPGSPCVLHLRNCLPTAQRSVGDGLGRRLQLATTREKQHDIHAYPAGQLLWA